MFQEPAYQLFAFVFLFAVSSFSAAKDEDILFQDDFNRADAGWWRMIGSRMDRLR